MVRSRDESYFKDVERAIKREHPDFVFDELNPPSLFEINYDYPKNYDSPDFVKGWNSTVAKDWKQQAEDAFDDWDVKKPFSMDEQCYISYDDELRFVPQLTGWRKEAYEEDSDGISPASKRESVRLAERYRSWEDGWFDDRGTANRLDTYSHLWPQWEGKSPDYVCGAMDGGGYVSQHRLRVGKDLGILKEKKGERVESRSCNMVSSSTRREDGGFVVVVDGKDGGPYGKTSFAVTLLRTAMCSYGFWPNPKEVIQKFQLVNTLEDYVSAVKQIGEGTFATILFDDIDEYAWAGRKVSDKLQKIFRVASGYGICTIATAARFSELAPRVQQTVKHVYRVGSDRLNIHSKETLPGDFPIDLREEDWHSFDNRADKTLYRKRHFGVLQHDVKVDRDGKIRVEPNQWQKIVRKGVRNDIETYLYNPFFEVSDDPAYVYLQKLKSDSLDAILEDGVEGFGNTEEVERKGRNDVIKKLVDSGVITQKQLADGVGLHASQISRIVNE